MFPTQALTKEQARSLLESIESDESGPLHKALLFTLWMTGLRKSAVLNLKRQDYFETNHGMILRVTDKGGKQLQKLVHPELELALEEYLDWMRDRSRERSPTDWLFVPTKNPKDPTNLEKQINPKTLNRIIEKYCQKVGISGKISAHSARATFIEVLLDSGANIIDVKDEVGHKSVTTTQEYDKRRKGLRRSLVRSLDY